MPDSETDSEVVTIIERVPLKPAFATPEGALKAGNAYDHITHQNAHAQPGHVGHATFFFESGPTDDTGYLVLIYPWRGRSGVVELLRTEEPILIDWMAFYAAGPRQ